MDLAWFSNMIARWDIFLPIFWALLAPRGRLKQSASGMIRGPTACFQSGAKTPAPRPASPLRSTEPDLPLFHDLLQTFASKFASIMATNALVPVCIKPNVQTEHSVGRNPVTISGPSK